jgi:hypothetical protein
LTRVQNDKLAACRKDFGNTYYGFEVGLAFEVAAQQTLKMANQAVYSMESQIVPLRPTVSSMQCDGARDSLFRNGTVGFVAAGLIVDMIAKDQLKAQKCLGKGETN